MRSPIAIAKPFQPVICLGHQPSSTDRFSPPFNTTFCPLVPDASCGRRGLFSHTSRPAQNAVHVDVVILHEHQLVGKLPVRISRATCCSTRFPVRPWDAPCPQHKLHRAIGSSPANQPFDIRKNQVAAYKRNLILTDIERLVSLVNDPNRPVQFVFAAGASMDEPGKRVLQAAIDRQFCRQLVFVEDYDINVGRHLCRRDVWLNNPRVRKRRRNERQKWC